jgi:hypothetical protein
MRTFGIFIGLVVCVFLIATFAWAGPLGEASISGGHTGTQHNIGTCSNEDNEGQNYSTRITSIEQPGDDDERMQVLENHPEDWMDGMVLIDSTDDDRYQNTTTWKDQCTPPCDWKRETEIHLYTDPGPPLGLMYGLTSSVWEKVEGSWQKRGGTYTETGVFNYHNH